MKKLKKLLVFTLCILLLTGCTMKQQYGIKINSDKSVELSVILAMDNELIDYMIASDEEDSSSSYDDSYFSDDTYDGIYFNDDTYDDSYDSTYDDYYSDSTYDDTYTDYYDDSTYSDSTYDDGSFDISGSLDGSEAPTHTDEERWAYLEESFNSNYGGIQSLEEQGYTVERYEEGSNVKGYTVTKKYDHIDDLLATSDDPVALEDDMSSTSTFLQDPKLFTKSGNRYRVEFEELSGNESDTSYSGMFDFTMVVELPSKAIDQNATSVSEDGKTLTWNLLEMTGESIYFEFEFTNIWFYVGIGAAAIVLIIAVLVVLAHVTNKKNRSNGGKVGTTPTPNPTNGMGNGTMTTMNPGAGGVSTASQGNQSNPVPPMPQPNLGGSGNAVPPVAPHVEMTQISPEQPVTSTSLGSQQVSGTQKNDIPIIDLGQTQTKPSSTDASSQQGPQA